ncbi:g10781 [Coccomyxa elongata]
MFAALEKGIFQAAEASGMPARAARRHHAGRAHQTFHEVECQALKRDLRTRARQGAAASWARGAAHIERHYDTIIRCKRRAHRVQQLKHLIIKQHQDSMLFRNIYAAAGAVQLSRLQQWDAHLHKLADES